MTTCRTAAAALVLAVSTTVTACAPTVPQATEPGGGLWGLTFLSTAVTEDGEPRPLVEGTRIELGFPEEGRVYARAGCNTMSGTVSLRDGALVVAELGMTEMGCPPGRMEQDSWVAEFLSANPRLRLDGDELTLTGGTVTIVLTDRRVADPDRPLTLTTWVVDTLYDDDAASSVPQEAPATLVIDESGGFEATTGCTAGTLTGTATIAPGRITVVVTAAVPCAGGSNVLDTAVRGVLSGELTYEITARRLRLVAPDGTGLGLVAEG